jgi:hypothetical protein
MSSDFNPTDLAALDEQRAATKEQTRFETAVELDDIKWLMGSKRGRRIVWRMLAECRLFQQSFDGNANWSIFNEGKRSVGLKLMAQIHAVDGGADAYALMCNEARTKVKANG